MQNSILKQKPLKRIAGKHVAHKNFILLLLFVSFLMLFSSFYFSYLKIENALDNQAWINGLKKEFINSHKIRKSKKSFLDAHLNPDVKYLSKLEKFSLCKVEISKLLQFKPNYTYFFDANLKRTHLELKNNQIKFSPDKKRSTSSNLYKEEFLKLKNEVFVNLDDLTKTLKYIEYPNPNIKSPQLVITDFSITKNEHHFFETFLLDMKISKKEFKKGIL
jgi:hypothetical protein